MAASPSGTKGTSFYRSCWRNTPKVTKWGTRCTIRIRTRLGPPVVICAPFSRNTSTVTASRYRCTDTIERQPLRYSRTPTKDVSFLVIRQSLIRMPRRYINIRRSLIRCNYRNETVGINEVNSSYGNLDRGN